MKTKKHINKYNKKLIGNIYVEKKEEAILIFYYFIRCTIIFELLSILITILKFGFTRANILVTILTLLMYLIIIISKSLFISWILIASYFIKCCMSAISIPKVVYDFAFFNIVIGIFTGIWLLCIIKTIDSIYLYSKLKKNPSYRRDCPHHI